MQAQAVKNTAPELLLRRRLYALGLRYRIHARPVGAVRREADIVFTKAKVAVFVDGCFWHCCPDHGTQPLKNSEWWAAKFARTVARDADTNARLTDAGWCVVRVWEHEDPSAASQKVVDALRRQGS
jgi:DNA mismatch endonuclease (patch repair protein)